jgi:hypothetical protein
MGKGQGTLAITIGFYGRRSLKGSQLGSSGGASVCWQAAARIFYDLRRQGLTVRSPIDCCIAQASLENDLILIHNDRDFETIAQVRSLQHLRFQS